MINGLAPIAPLGTFSDSKVGPHPRLATGRVAKSFYLSLIELILTTLRFPDVAWGVVVVV